MNTWAENILSFYQKLEPPDPLPDDIQWLYPQKNPVVLSIVKEFYSQYYNDHHKRTILLGINPGRFGAGITGINFTAPRQLSEFCGIEHSFKKQSELSAEFIYEVVNNYGGPGSFYYEFFIGSVCPLGFIQNGKNLNYYDNKELLQKVEPFIIQHLDLLFSFNVNRENCICIGGEKNFRYLNALNEKKKWFKQIDVLPHPRFIMQYKRRQKEEYIDQYLRLLQKQ